VHNRQRGVSLKSNEEGVPTATGSVRRVWTYRYYGTSNPRLSIQPVHEPGWANAVKVGLVHNRGVNLV